VRVVIGTLALAYPGGTESYCLTVARALDRLGHDVTLFADELGPLADRAAAGGFDVARELAELPAACEAVLANDAITAGLLAERYPDTRLVYCIHSSLHDVQLPPLAPGLVDAIVVPSERFAAHSRALALDVPVVRLTQPIDTERFAPSEGLRVPPRRALLLTNYLDGRRRDALVETWTAAGIECVEVGIGDQVAFDVRPEIAAADIVVAKARAALEGMACGKAVYVFDVFGGDGWVTSDNYAALEADNFAGQATDRPVDRRGLAADLDRYDPDMGWINREIVVTHHCARSHAQALVEVLRGPPPRRPDSASSPAAAARTVRSAWRMQQRAAGIAREATGLRARVSELTADVDAAEEAVRSARTQIAQARDDAGALTAERDAWSARARDAERQLDAARELVGTRRVRAGLVLGRCLDRVRGRRR
jgi:hypothetical protein